MKFRYTLKMNIFIILLLVTFEISCKRQNKIQQIYFYDSFPKWAKNLAYKLGNEFSIYDGKDTVTFLLSYRKKDKVNIILFKNTLDTIFMGKVSKYRGLYYFNHKLGENKYLISAIKIKDNYITGLLTEPKQMELITNEITKTPYKKYFQFRDTINKICLVTPDKLLLRNLYSKIIKGLPSYPLVNKNRKPIPDNLQQPESLNSENEQDLIDAIYPNPVTDYCNIIFEEKGKYEILIINSKGDSILHETTATDQIKIDLRDKQAGIYTIKIYSPETQETETKKITLEK